MIGIVDVVDAIVRDGDPPRHGTAEDGTQGVGLAATPARSADDDSANDDSADNDSNVTALITCATGTHVILGDQGVGLCEYHGTITVDEPVAGGDAAHAEWWPLDRLDELSLWTETVRIITEAAALAKAARREPR